MLSVIMLTVIMLNVTYKTFMLSVVMLNVIMLSVVVPQYPCSVVVAETKIVYKAETLVTLVELIKRLAQEYQTTAIFEGSKLKDRHKVTLSANRI
jgi:hypothetical protein